MDVESLAKPPNAADREELQLRERALRDIRRTDDAKEELQRWLRVYQGR